MEGEDYSPDNFNDAFESFEDNVSLGVRAEIQQPRSSFNADESFGPHEYVIHIDGSSGAEEERGREQGRAEEEEKEEEEGEGDVRGEANVDDLPLPYNISGRRNTKKCIFEVPKCIREVGKSANTPQSVSIGAYHYGDPNLSDMESHKKKLFAAMRSNPDRRSSLRATMAEFEAKARECYSTKFNHIHTDTFQEMMLTDAFFIIHCFISFDRWCKNPDDGELQRQPTFAALWKQPDICQDLLMLENQLPFFILVQVYSILTNKSANDLKKLAIQFFKRLEFGRSGGDSVKADTSSDNPKHLLDLFHSTFVVVVDKNKKQKPKKTSSSSSLPKKTPIRMETEYWVSNASTLTSNGVKFIGTKGNPLDIQFNNNFGNLKVPTLGINDKTITVLKNLLAYELELNLPNPYFTCLVVFFSHIAATAENVKLLREAEIINHQLPDDGAVVLLLKQLYKVAQQNGFNSCLIKQQLELIDKYVASDRARIMSFMRREAVPILRSVVLFLGGTILFSSTIIWDLLPIICLLLLLILILIPLF